MKSIVFFTSNLNSGGLENYLLRFLKYKSNEYNTIFIWCKSGAGGVLEKEIETYGKVVKIKILFFDFHNFYRLFTFLKKEKIDIICDFTGNFSGIIMLIGYIAKIKNRITFYRGSENHFRSGLLKNLYDKIVNRLVLIFSTKILFNSSYAIKYYFKNIKSNKFDVVYNGFDQNQIIKLDSYKLNNLKKELNIKENSFIIGHTGRYHYSKNHDTIIKVAISICKTNKFVYFVLAGDGVDKKYEKIVERESLSDRILLLGYRKDVLNLLNIFDLFYFPSITEGQPNSLIEAMVSGLPILASDIPTIKECVPNYFAKNLIKPTDTELTIKRIQEIIEKRILLDDLILKDWAIENFNHKKLYNKFYNSLI
jgi:Glycosyltransferase